MMTVRAALQDITRNGASKISGWDQFMKAMEKYAPLTVEEAAQFLDKPSKLKLSDERALALLKISYNDDKAFVNCVELISKSGGFTISRLSEIYEKFFDQELIGKHTKAQLVKAFIKKRIQRVNFDTA